MQPITITPNKNNAKGQYADKETVNAWSVIVANPAKPEGVEELITVRWYQGRSAGANSVYCNVWLRGKYHNSGHGAAGGGGYCKHSTAFDQALENAGVNYPKELAGRGFGMVRTALEQTVKALGFDKCLIVEH